MRALMIVISVALALLVVPQSAPADGPGESYLVATRGRPGADLTGKPAPGRPYRVQTTVPGADLSDSTGTKTGGAPPLARGLSPALPCRDWGAT